MSYIFTSSTYLIQRSSRIVSEISKADLSSTLFRGSVFSVEYSLIHRKDLRPFFKIHYEIGVTSAHHPSWHDVDFIEYFKTPGIPLSFCLQSAACNFHSLQAFSGQYSRYRKGYVYGLGFAYSLSDSEFISVKLFRHHLATAQECYGGHSYDRGPHFDKSCFLPDGVPTALDIEHHTEELSAGFTIALAEG